MLSTKQAAKYLMVSTKYLRNLVKTGEIKVYNPTQNGKKFLFKQSWLDDYIEKNTTRAV